MQEFFKQHGLSAASIEEKYNSTPAEFYRDVIRAERDSTEAPVWGIWKSEDDVAAASNDAKSKTAFGATESQHQR
jgi:hypothetical protein